MEDLKPGGHDDGTHPPPENIRWLVRELRRRWTSGTLHVGNVMTWVCRVMEIDPVRFTWNEFQEAHKIEKFMVRRLQVFMKNENMQGEAATHLYEVANVVFNLADVATPAEIHDLSA